MRVRLRRGENEEEEEERTVEEKEETRGIIEIFFLIGFFG